MYKRKEESGDDKFQVILKIHMYKFDTIWN